jgi:hypothetical protein
LRRFALALLAGALAAWGAALPAEAKEDVRATLTTRIPMNALPGTRIEVAWKLFYREGGKRHPFGASGVFVRLVSASGDRASEGFAPDRAGRVGEYRASVVVPAGGVSDVVIGLMGWQSDANGTRRADMLFPITNEPAPVVPLIAASVPERPAPAEDPAGGLSVRTVVVLAGTVAALAAVAAGLVVRRRRSVLQQSS